MDKQFRCQEKHVHDFAVEKGTVRVWNAEGAHDGKLIGQAFAPLLKTSFVYPYIALMPDYHPGQDAMVGSVIPTRGMILPSVIGGDLGCGMAAVRLPVDEAEAGPALEELREQMCATVPVGSEQNPSVSKRVEDNAIWKRELQSPLLNNRVRDKLIRQFASLGGGNHFIEIDVDGEGRLWVVVHSGSRGLGTLVRDHYLERGASVSGIDKKLYSKVPHLLAGEQLAKDYLSDMAFALEFARESRKEMVIRILEVFESAFAGVRTIGKTSLAASAIDMPHNIIAVEEHFGETLFIHRKGAARAAQGDVGVIPGSMGGESFIVEGRGSCYSFCSSSHGAGRAMSRSDAFRRISAKDFQNSMANVVYRHDDRLIDESPLAYKNVRKVMRGQRDLVKILYELRPLLSIKGVEHSTRKPDENAGEASPG